MFQTQFADALDELLAEGISWLSFVPAADGPNPELCADQGEQGGLLLLLSFGDRFGSRVPYEAAPPDAHPFDARSRALALRFVEKARLPNAELVYPGTAPLDLRAWLAAGRVQHRSPLGTGVRPDCGPWLAVRAALAVSLSPDRRAVLTQRFPPLTPESSPCASCEERPCARACPAQAVSEVGAFRLMDCVEERLREDSACASRCNARLACPVGSTYRYPERQLRYHYGVSLKTLQQYFGR
jgi:hypothetical protein